MTVRSTIRPAIRPTSVLGLLFALFIAWVLALSLPACIDDNNPAKLNLEGIGDGDGGGDDDGLGDDDDDGDGDDGDDDIDDPPPTGLFTWPTSSPEAQGVDGDLLDEAFRVAEELLYMHSVVVVRHDTLVGERYYHGYDTDVPHDIESVAKSFLAAIVGLALREAHFDSLEGKALDLFPEYNFDYENDDDNFPKPLISFEHLLTMKAGWGGDEDNRDQVVATDDWIGNTFALPLLEDPGTEFAFSTLGTHVLAGCVARASGQSTFDFADAQLFAPLGIDCDLWQQDPQGYHRGGDGMWFTPREMARFGQLYLRGGFLDDTQILPADWVAASFEDAAGGTWVEGLIFLIGYGYGWWTGWLAGEDIIFVRGYGGQFIVLIPSLDLIVVTTAYMPPDSAQATAQEHAITEFIINRIYPAIGD